MRNASGSLPGCQKAGSKTHTTNPHPEDETLELAGWGPAVFFAAMIVIMMISVVLVTAIAYR
jgi:hypothetical protein